MASNCKYYLSSSDTNGIGHHLNITATYTDPSTITDVTKATWGNISKSVPASSNLPDINSSADSNYIYECKSVTSTATTGNNVQFISTLYYTFI